MWEYVLQSCTSQNGNLIRCRICWFSACWNARVQDISTKEEQGKTKSEINVLQRRCVWRPVKFPYLNTKADCQVFGLDFVSSTADPLRLLSISLFCVFLWISFWSYLLSSQLIRLSFCLWSYQPVPLCCIAMNNYAYTYTYACRIITTTQ